MFGFQWQKNTIFYYILIYDLKNTIIINYIFLILDEIKFHKTILQLL